MIVIGLGTGRCGTVSLSKLLDLQDDSHVTHESEPRLPWKVDEELLLRKLRYFSSIKKSLVGCVAFYYLPYVELINRYFDGNVRFVCLKRDKEATVSSYLKKVGKRNHWVEHDGSVYALDPVWDRCYPKYETNDIRDAVSRYYDEYYQTSHRLENEMSNFKVFPMESLNSFYGVNEILDFLSVPKKHIYTNIRLNVGC